MLVSGNGMWHGGFFSPGENEVFVARSLLRNAGTAHVDDSIECLLLGT